MHALKIDDLNFADEVFELSSKTKAGYVFKESQVITSGYNQSGNASPEQIAQVLNMINNTLAIPNIGVNLPPLSSLANGLL